MVPPSLSFSNLRPSNRSQSFIPPSSAPVTRSTFRSHRRAPTPRITVFTKSSNGSKLQDLVIAEQGESDLDSSTTGSRSVVGEGEDEGEEEERDTLTSLASDEREMEVPVLDNRQRDFKFENMGTGRLGLGVGVGVGVGMGGIGGGGGGSQRNLALKAAQGSLREKKMKGHRQTQSLSLLNNSSSNPTQFPTFNHQNSFNQNYSKPFQTNHYQNLHRNDLESQLEMIMKSQLELAKRLGIQLQPISPVTPKFDQTFNPQNQIENLRSHRRVTSESLGTDPSLTVSKTSLPSLEQIGEWVKKKENSGEGSVKVNVTWTVDESNKEVRKEFIQVLKNRSSSSNFREIKTPTKSDFRMDSDVKEREVAGKKMLELLGRKKSNRLSLPVMGSLESLVV